MSSKRLAATERANDIVQATIAVFARGGAAAATTREIAKAAGVSEALVFRHFPTKDSLYCAVLRSRIEEADRFLPLDETLHSLGDEEFFLRIATMFLDRVQADDSFTRLFLYCGLEGHELAREFYGARTERLLSAIERRLRRMARSGLTRKGLDPAIAARLFFALSFGVVVSKFILGDRSLRRTSNRRLASGIVSQFLNGLRRPKEAA